MYLPLLSVIVGGSTGCVLRWWLGLRLNSLFAGMPLGTLLDNLVGGFVIGGAMAFFMRWPHLDPAWRLLITTGFCGGLTTFSTFSAEVLSMLMHGRYGWAMATVSAHVLGSLLMTFAGFALVRWLG